MLDTERIRRFREKLGLSQEAAAKRAGLSGRQQWWNIEAGGRVNVSMAMLDRIAEALECDPSELVKRPMRGKVDAVKRDPK